MLCLPLQLPIGILNTLPLILGNVMQTVEIHQLGPASASYRMKKSVMKLMVQAIGGVKDDESVVPRRCRSIDRSVNNTKITTIREHSTRRRRHRLLRNAIVSRGDNEHYLRHVSDPTIAPLPCTVRTSGRNDDVPRRRRLPSVVGGAVTDAGRTYSHTVSQQRNLRTGNI